MDDHPGPIEELVRLRGLHELYFGDTKPEAVVWIAGEVEEEIAKHLRRLGHLESGGDEASLLDALSAFIRTENFEEREQPRGYVDRAVLGLLSEENRGRKEG